MKDNERKMTLSVETSAEACCRELLGTAVRMNRVPPAELYSEIASALEKLVRSLDIDQILLGGN